MINKIKFYDTVCITIGIGLAITILSLLIVPKAYLESFLFLIPWIFTILIVILGDIIFTIGMIISAFKIKRYGWIIGIILLGTIVPIIFYFSIMRKEFRRSE